jgi:hypothetical protein
LPESWALAEKLHGRRTAARSTSHPEETRILEVLRRSVACLWILLGILLNDIL